MIKESFWKWLVVFLGSMLASLLFVLFFFPHEEQRKNNWALVDLETGEIYPFEDYVGAGRSSVQNLEKLCGSSLELTDITIKEPGGGLIFLGEMSGKKNLLTGNVFMEEEQERFALINQRDGRYYSLSGNGFSVWTSEYYLTFFRQAVKNSGEEKIRYGLSILY